ncbi:NRPS [Paraconiothyrium brasiliense]|uniref:NRPS n=1 Tax=Paraconiothyrium brasiliense TaxID=300254 RepID=A0ABR3RK06_9PLEO
MLSTTTLLEDVADVLRRPIATLNLDASFLDNGGDSLSLLQFQQELRRNGVFLSATFIFSAISLAELLHLAAESIASNPLLPRQSTKRKFSFDAGVAAKRARMSEAGDLRSVVIPRAVDYTHSYPMTEMQFTLLRGSLSNPTVNVIHYHETHHPRNVPLLKTAWKAITDAEPILRCTYKLYESSAHLVEQNNSVFNWKEVLVSDNEAFEHSIREQEVGENFFSSSFRVVTLRESDKRAGKSRIIWRVHHSLVDGYSHLLLLSKVKSILLGEKLSPTIPFAAFTAGLYALQTGSKATGDAFWKARHAKYLPSVSHLPLPAPSTCVAQQTDFDPVVEIHIDHGSLSERCRDLGFTLPTLYHAAWALTLAKYTGSKNICFGTVLCGRALPIPNIESLIGPTINTLPLHVQLEGVDTIVDLMSQIFEQLMALALHQWTAPEHGFTRDFHTAMNIQVDNESISEPMFDMLEMPFSSIRSEIPLQVEVVQGGRLRMHYNVDVLDRRQVERLSQTFKAVLSMAWDSNPSLNTCLSSNFEKPEREELSRLGNWKAPGTRTESVREDLVSLFLQAARSNPSAIALQKSAKTMTYDQLDVLSTQIARRLSQLIDPRSVICVHADASFNWIVAIYAVLKAGCAYCPFIEGLPTEMRAQNFATSGAQLFLATSERAKANKPQDCKMCFSVDDLLAMDVDDTGHDELHRMPDPSANAYLCFTSGSTGKPKGVMCQHAGLVAFQTDFTVRLCARPDWKVAQFMSPAFDGSIHEIFSTLSYGATLLLKDPTDPLEHLRHADAAILTPSVARALEPADYPDLKTVYLVGEAVTPDVRDSWTVKTLYNMYGPTEATCGATIKRILPDEPITLGNPNPSTRLYILNSQQQLSPRGVIGEICLAGVQVSSGYLNRPDETAKRFMLDPINPETQEYLYKTGDRGYWDDNGELVFLGRSDRQIKLRGFRIDMDDLEVRMLKSSTEATAIAVALGEDELVALVTPSSLDLGKFRLQIAAEVPSYALPRRISAVDEFPMTSAGKLDYKRIGREAKLVAVVPGTGVSPTPVISMVISSIREALGGTISPVIGPDSDLLDSGVTSMTLLLLSQRLSKVLARRISVRHLLQWRTPRQLAHCIEKLEDDNRKDEEGVLGESNVAPIEADWWAKYQIGPDTSAFNVNFVCALDTTIDIQELARAWNLVLARHRILRCKYQGCEISGIRRLYDEEPPTAKIVDSIDVDSEINTPFVISEGKLIRVVLSPSHMSVVVSHIICDLTTLNILLQEVADAYQGRTLLPVKKQYSQTSWATVPPATHLAFWTSYLKDARAPTFFDRAPKKKGWAGTSHTIEISEHLYARILEHAAAQKVTMHQMALAAVALALRVDDEEDVDITIGAPYLNRNSEEDQDVVGLFLEPLPIRIQYSLSDEERTQHSFLRTIKVASRSALSHAISFNHLVSCLGTTIDYPNHPLFDAVVTFHEASRQPSFPVAGTRSLELWSQGAKFALLAEFSETGAGKLVLRLEYSTECFTKSDMVLVGQRIERSLECLGSGKGFAGTLHGLRG